MKQNTKSSKSRSKKKNINEFDPFQRVDPKLLERMYREAMKKKQEQAPF